MGQVAHKEEVEQVDASVGIGIKVVDGGDRIKIFSHTDPVPNYLFYESLSWNGLVSYFANCQNHNVPTNIEGFFVDKEVEDESKEVFEVISEDPSEDEKLPTDIEGFFGKKVPKDVRKSNISKLLNALTPVSERALRDTPRVTDSEKLIELLGTEIKEEDPYSVIHDVGLIRRVDPKTIQEDGRVARDDEKALVEIKGRSSVHQVFDLKAIVQFYIDAVNGNLTWTKVVVNNN